MHWDWQIFLKQKYIWNIYYPIMVKVLLTTTTSLLYESPLLCLSSWYPHHRTHWQKFNSAYNLNHKFKMRRLSPIQVRTWRNEEEPNPQINNPIPLLIFGASVLCFGLACIAVSLEYQIITWKKRITINYRTIDIFCFNKKKKTRDPHLSLSFVFSAIDLSNSSQFSFLCILPLKQRS